MITVSTKTGTIKVGGDFNQALTFIKGIQGRKFDGATKTWNVPLTAQELKTRMSGFPVEMPNGDHVTRYGNRYARNEWDAKCEAEKVNVTHDENRRAVRQQMIAELGEWIQADKIAFVANLIESFQLAGMMEYGKVKFSTPEKEAAILAIDDRYNAAMSKIIDAEEEEEAAKIERIYERYGVE